MLGRKTVCPKCRHEFTCCVSASANNRINPIDPNQLNNANNRRTLHVLSGGGLINGRIAAGGEDDGESQPSSLLVPAFNLSVGVGGCRSPETSPSAQLAFVLPFPVNVVTPTLSLKPEMELRRLSDSVRLLRDSGWYHEGLTWQQSQALLKATAPGTFLIRDSSDTRFLYALSVQTDHGPTSVRLHYVDGKFRLDSESYLAPVMPLFDTVLDLVTYYVKCSATNYLPAGTPRNGNAASSHVWVDTNGCMFSRILLRRPLRRTDQMPSLQHLARLAVHKALQMQNRKTSQQCSPSSHEQLELPVRLLHYLAEYPYSL